MISTMARKRWTARATGILLLLLAALAAGAAAEALDARAEAETDQQRIRTFFCCFVLVISAYAASALRFFLTRSFV